MPEGSRNTHQAFRPKSPNELFEYEFEHMGDPEHWKKLRRRLRQIKGHSEADEFLRHVLEFPIGRVYNLEPRKVLPIKTKRPANFRPTTVYNILTSLRTPATFTTLKKKRLMNRLSPTNLRAYVDVLLTHSLITLADIKFEEKRYPRNIVPRNKYEIYYETTPVGKKYIRAYERLDSIHSRLLSGIVDRF